MDWLSIVVKYTLFVLNLILALVGLVVVGVGVFMLLVLTDALDALPEVRPVSIGVIAVGGVIFLFGFFGCCGAITENTCLLMTFAVMMAGLAGVQIYIVVRTDDQFGDVSGTVNEWIEELFQRPGSREIFYSIEFVFRCCGTTGPDSYDGVMTFLPPTCCPGFELGSIDLGKWENITDITDIGSIGASVCLKEDAFGGCTENLTRWLDLFVKWIFYGLIIIIATEITLMLFAVGLTTTIQSEAKAKEAYY